MNIQYHRTSKIGTRGQDAVAWHRSHYSADGGHHGKKAAKVPFGNDRFAKPPTPEKWEAFPKEYNKVQGGKGAKYGPELAKNYFDKEKLDISKLDYFIRAFLLSATFKDCSIIIRPSASTSRSRTPSTNNIMIIDTEPKDINKLEKWINQNEHMVALYSTLKGGDGHGGECIDAHSALE